MNSQELNSPNRAAKRAAGSQRGQIFVMVALLLAIFCGMAAMAVDFGSYATERRDLQNAADAIALAAAQDLPNAAAALATAQEYATNNDIPVANVNVQFVSQNLPSIPNPKVIVTITDTHEFYFARAVGVNSASVQAKATAIKSSPAGGSNIVPLSVTEAALNGVALGNQVILKYDSNNITTGNTGPIRVDGPGAGNCGNGDGYCDGVMDGSGNVVCAQGVDQTYCTGPSVVDTEPGNMVGPTRTAINFRLDESDIACDEFDEIFEDDPNSVLPGDYRITQLCNPFLPGGPESHHVLIIPVIDQLCNGSCQVTIVDFAMFFLEGFNPGPGCTGNDCELVGRFVRVNQNVGLLAGTFDPTASNSFVRLTE